MLPSRKGFTLIELLVVIAIIAILSVVVILTLNPAELLRQSRDANRLSDMATIATAVNIYSTDQSGVSSFSMGSASTTYISVADPSATSTAGDQCQGLSISALPNSWNYHCASSSTSRSINGQGWVPINFSNISAGAPIGNLPLDNNNQSSSGLYYTYITDGTKYVVTAELESQKYLKQYVLSTSNDPARYAQGSNLSLVSPSEGLLGYWNFGEGTGTTAFDTSGSGNNGTWTGTATGTSGYYSAGKVGSWAGAFDGTTTQVSTTVAYATLPGLTMSVWVNFNSLTGGFQFPIGSSGALWRLGITSAGTLYFDPGTHVDQNPAVSVSTGVWHMLSVTSQNSTSTMNWVAYLDGQSVANGSVGGGVVSPTYITIGWDGAGRTKGLVDDVRIYGRALSAAEIQGIYNSEK